MSNNDRIDIDLPPSDDERNDQDYRPQNGVCIRKRSYRQIMDFERKEHVRQNEQTEWNHHLHLFPTHLDNEASLIEIERDAPMTSVMANSNSASSLAKANLNCSDEADYEPNAKRDKPSKVQEDEIEMVTQPVKEFRYKDSLLCLKYQIMNTLDECIAKLKEKQSTTTTIASSRSKKHNKENSTSVKQINEKVKSAEISDSSEKTFSFHLGQHKFKLMHLNKDYIDFEFNNDTSIFIYENTRMFRSTKSKNKGAQQSYLTKFEELEFYALLINKHLETSRWFKFYDIDELTKSILFLITTKTLYAVFNYFESAGQTSLVGINIELYLSDKLKSMTLAENPSECLVVKNAYFMNLIMTKFYFSLSNVVKLASDSLNVIIIKRHYDFMSEEESKQNNENLFDLVYNIHTKEFQDHFKSDLSSVESKFILEKSNLKTLLRNFQINAVKWMLKKEKFSFEPIASSAKNNMINNMNFLKEINNIESSKLSPNVTTKSEASLHPLYLEISDKMSQTIYYHKFLGVFTTQKPLQKESLPGGILADEMGLGKTLEILACILINQRSSFPEPNVIEPNPKLKTKNSETFSCLCGLTPSQFKSAYYTNKNSPVKTKVELKINQCILCGAWTHADCVNYKGAADEFLCLKCCTTVPPISSGCTLIVTPSIISHQWIDEIKKHVKADLKIMYYTGCNNKFIQPRELAGLDICVTTYDVLANELAHVFAIENMRQLRTTKRFMNVPSPLTCVEWWRICLDEAQMVHSSNTRCAEMANRLKAINRWCVTGTPIGRSLDDLYGLFTFIREDPYLESKWFKETLYKPYVTNDKEPMAKAVSKVLWRTAKKYVEDQINIPNQTERVYWFNFSPFEQHLYQRVLELFRENRRNAFRYSVNQNRNQFENTHAFIADEADSTENTESDNVNSYFQSYNKDLRLDEMERSLVDQILAPLLDLRLVCNHPQLVLRKRSFMPQGHGSKKEKLLTMEKSLQMLIKKTEKECENLLRLLTMHANAIAGIHILNENFETAKEIYHDILDYEKDYNHNVKLDLLQKVHTIFNLLYVLEKKTVSDKLDKSELLEQLNQLESTYTSAHYEVKTKEETKLKEKMAELESNFGRKNVKSYQEWLLGTLVKIEKSPTRSKEFWERLNNEFHTVYIRAKNSNKFSNENEKHSELSTQYSFRIFNKVCSSYSELKLLAASELDNLEKYRKILIQKTNVFFDKEPLKDNKTLGITSEMVRETADCHLRTKLMPNAAQNRLEKISICELCKCENAFKDYSSVLYANSDDAIKIASAKDINESEDEEKDFDDFNEKQAQYQLQMRATSEIEKLNQLLISFTKNFEDNNIARKFADDYTSLKEEFKSCRQYWITVSNTISAYDELDMAKTRMRLRQPNEKNEFKLAHIIEPHEISLLLDNNQNEKKVREVELKKKYGQIIYLKTLMKTNSFTENEKNEQPCPICQNQLGFEWYVLSCGHSFCKECHINLLNSNNHYMLPAASNGSKVVRCALCRELSTQKETCLVCTKTKNLESPRDNKKLCQAIKDKNYEGYNTDELKNIKIKGNCNSAKVEGIVKCLIKILRQDRKAKCLVFSEHITMLELIQNLLKDNLIDYKLIKDSQSFQKNIQEFKKNADLNVLLMPYTYGANGLNIIEATHVLLVEPTLNRAQELQAIGRVHRIGQTKPTFVYRFVICDTVEELVYNLFRNNDSYSKKPEINRSEPNSSAALAANEFNSDADCKQFNERKIVKICDLQRLFSNL